jgi:hypothetical protein
VTPLSAKRVRAAEQVHARKDADENKQRPVLRCVLVLGRVLVFVFVPMHLLGLTCSGLTEGAHAALARTL